MPDQETAQPGAAANTPEIPREGRDLLSVALLVFFVGLLVIVAALTLLPLILG